MFVTNHARVLLSVAGGPQQTVRQIADQVGITERAAHRVIGNLVEAGYLDRRRVGRRAEYRLNVDTLRVESNDRARAVRELVALLATSASPQPEAGTP
jgi:DNA-binding IclR family transcriptional regulator